MSNGVNHGEGRYTSFFTSVPAGDVHVAGLKAGSAGSRGVPNALLTSLAGLFTVDPDVVQLLPAGPEKPFLRRFMPPRPATQANVPGPLMFADAD